MYSTTIAHSSKAELISRLQALLAELTGGTTATTEAAPAKPKAEKPKKQEEPAKQEELNLGGSSANDELDALLGGDTPPPEPEGPTEDDMKSELRKVLGDTAKGGKDVVTKILRKFGAMVVGDIQAADRAKVIETCKAVLARK